MESIIIIYKGNQKEEKSKWKPSVEWIVAATNNYIAVCSYSKAWGSTHTITIQIMIFIRSVC